MNYPIKVEGFIDQNIEVQSDGLFSGYKLLVNGVPAPKGSKRGQMMLRRNDGRIAIASWKPKLLGLDFPQLVIDDKIINIIEPLKWYETLWIGLPILLFFYGGVLGAIAGMFGFSINAKIFRNSINSIAKYGLTALVSVLTVVVYFVAVILFLNIVK